MGNGAQVVVPRRSPERYTTTRPELWHRRRNKAGPSAPGRRRPRLFRGESLADDGLAVQRRAGGHGGECTADCRWTTRPSSGFRPENGRRCFEQACLISTPVPRPLRPRFHSVAAFARASTTGRHCLTSSPGLQAAESHAGPTRYSPMVRDFFDETGVPILYISLSMQMFKSLKPLPSLDDLSTRHYSGAINPKASGGRASPLVQRAAYTDLRAFQRSVRTGLSERLASTASRTTCPPPPFPTRPR